jgi:hypothetical protein
MNDQLKNHWRLLILFVFLVLLNGFYLGNVSKDSMQYLQLAKNLNLSMFIHKAQVPENFGVWPLLYPMLIKIIATPLIFLSKHLIFKTELTSTLDWQIWIFASKILNLLLLLPLWLIIKRWILSEFLLFFVLSPSMLLIYSFTWSECCFMLFFTAFALQFENIWSHFKTQQDVGSRQFTLSVVDLNLLILYACLAFLSRYIGVILMLPLLILAWRLFRFDQVKPLSFHRWHLLKLPLIFGILIILTLGINFDLTGHFTGMNRAPNVTGIMSLLLSLIKAVTKEFLVVLPLILALILGLGVGFGLGLGLLLMKDWILLGFCVYYLICLLIMRCTQHFDIFSTRLVYPGCFLALFWLFRQLSVLEIRQALGIWLKPSIRLSLSFSLIWFLWVFVGQGINDAKKHVPFFWNQAVCERSLPSSLVHHQDSSSPIFLAPRKALLQQSGRYEAYLEHACVPFQTSFLDAPYHRAETLDEFWRRLHMNRLPANHIQIKGIQLDFIGYEQFNDYWMEMRNDNHQYHPSIEAFLKQQFKPDSLVFVASPSF